jgi:predicted Fe-Mo cluster-binding NifX family protein
MRIAISATRPSLDAPMDERFGRCPCFVIADQEGTVYDLVDNPYRDLGSGAGIQAASLLVKRGVSVVLTGRCGPKASETLAAAGVGVVTGCSGAVREALKKFTTGLRNSVAAKETPANANPPGRGSSAHSGVATVPDGFARGGGRGMGRGTGRGMGGGSGRGRGRGLGRADRAGEPTDW